MSPMPRMRPATRSGWNSSSASIFSPRPTKRIGLPVTARIESAAPPRPSPSMRVRTTPEMPTRPSNCSATLTASWPVRPSTTSSVSCGLVGVAHRLRPRPSARRRCAAGRRCRASPRRSRRASPAAWRAWRSPPASWPGTIGSVSTPTWAPRMASCSIAAGRRVSSEAISTRLPSRSFSRRASLAVVVVLPEPCRPTISIGAGGLSMRSAPRRRRRRRARGPARRGRS